ncbi:MAG TPA: hypothetical protein VLH10_25620 [Yinghuangia sp.]|uniref:hypothetical protein n=1 Tax=Yinghuangia sp. YIM S10712 TaxID=3436930 RepID=UPI002C00B18A|nr:hypothetical protein [Yinghuangia sp.]
MPGLPPAAPAELPGEEPEATGAPVVGVESAVRAQEARPEETDAERRRRRALFLRELAEAHELRERIQPRRTRTARLRQMMRMRTFRY